MQHAPFREVLNLLQFAAASRMAWGTRIVRSHRPSHSAGALHPIEIILIATRGQSRVFRYEPLAGRVALLQPARPAWIANLVKETASILPDARTDLLVLLADPLVVEAVYENPMSLIWRDAGALMQTLHLSATALRLGFCPIGVQGHETAEAIFGDEHRLIGTGMAAVGRSSSD